MGKTPKKGTMAFYRMIEEENTQLRSRLLAHTPKLPNETSREWLNRVNQEYQRLKKEFL